MSKKIKKDEESLVEGSTTIDGANRHKHGYSSSNGVGFTTSTIFEPGVQGEDHTHSIIKGKIQKGGADLHGHSFAYEEGAAAKLIENIKRLASKLFGPSQEPAPSPINANLEKAAKQLIGSMPTVPEGKGADPGTGDGSPTMLAVVDAFQTELGEIEEKPGDFAKFVKRIMQGRNG